LETYGRHARYHRTDQSQVPDKPLRRSFAEGERIRAMMDRDRAAQITTSPSLRPVAILVFSAKLMVASFLVAQASLLPASPVSQVYGLSR
jgi:hypothetical protein